MNTLTRTSKKNQKGFSLIELLGILVLLAIMAAVIVPVFRGDQRRVNENDALSRAQILDLAKLSLLRRQGQEISKKWDEVQDDQTRYEMLQPYLVQPPALLGDGVMQNTFTPLGYYYILNHLQQPTTLIRLSDSKLLAGPPQAEK